MNIGNFLNKESVQIGASSLNKNSILEDIAKLAKKNPILKNIDREEIYRRLKERETLHSTGIGGGIAIPHCRLDNISDFVMGVLIEPRGVDYNAIDNQKAKLFFFIVGPTDEKKNTFISYHRSRKF